ncbi:MAG TPA: hypothetical protein VN719_09615 [Gemmatimonadales bacterium]|nr:hypothetical protein [Gemmatimonadales bacterium]
MFKLASLFVEVSAKSDKFNSALSSIHSRLSAASVAVGTFAGNVATAFARMTFEGVGAGFQKTIVSASHLAETTSKVGVVFKQNTAQIMQLSNEMARSFGIPRGELLDAAAMFGLIAKGAGMSTAEAAKLSQQMSKLAIDATSFYDLPLDSALEKIRAGLVGEAEPLRALGIMLSEDAVKAEGLRLGFIKAGQELTNLGKIQVRAQLIAKGLSDAQGDLARTQSSFANQSREVWGRLENTLTGIGEKLLPAANSILNGVNKLAQSVFESIEGHLPTIQAFADRIATYGKYIGLAWKELPTVFELAKIKAQELALQVQTVFSRFGSKVWDQLVWGANAAQVAIRDDFIGLVNFSIDLFGQMAKAFSSLLNNAIDSVAAKWKPLLAAVFGPHILLSGGKEAVPAIKPNFGLLNQNPFANVGPRPEFNAAEIFKDLPNLAGKAKEFWDKLGQSFDTQQAKERLTTIFGNIGTAVGGFFARVFGGGKNGTPGGALAQAPKKEKKPEIDSLTEFAFKLRAAQFGKDSQKAATDANTKALNAATNAYMTATAGMTKPTLGQQARNAFRAVFGYDV